MKFRDSLIQELSTANEFADSELERIQVLLEKLKGELELEKRGRSMGIIEIKLLKTSLVSSPPPPPLLPSWINGLIRSKASYATEESLLTPSSPLTKPNSFEPQKSIRINQLEYLLEQVQVELETLRGELGQWKLMAQELERAGRSEKGFVNLRIEEILTENTSLKTR